MELSPSAGSKPVVVSVAPSCRKRSLRQMCMLNFLFVKESATQARTCPLRAGPANPLQERATAARKAYFKTRLRRSMHEIAARSGNCQFVGTSARPTADSIVRTDEPELLTVVG